MVTISVLMPVYNADRFIKETIDSILCQSFRDFEVLVMDDGSTDCSANIILSYSDPRIHYELCPHDFIATLNRGIEIAQGKYIARIDHDDLMTPDRLQIQYDFMEANPHIAACGACMQTFGNSSYTINVLTEHDDIVQYMLLGNPMANPTGFIRRSFLLEHNIRHEDGYFFADDFKLWSEIVKAGGKLANIPKTLTKYRTSDKQASVVNYGQMMAASRVIRYEMLQYFLKSFIPTDKLGETVAEKVLPSIEELNDRGFFSQDTYFKFMYDLIHGLSQRNSFNFQKK
ncbi:MAG: glycosyltransferase family 2 protein [Bacteroidales bacterium]|jgi:glycosyltransferase involved in cell wall biosynthesis|nr:glycosyltransferase family 2 protein [Bacteroidales bacterium]